MNKVVSQETATQVIEVVKNAMGALCEMSQSLWESMVKQQYIIGSRYGIGAIMVIVLCGFALWLAKRFFDRYKKDDDSDDPVGFGISFACSIGCICWAFYVISLVASRFLIPEYHIFKEVLQYIQ